MSPSFIKTTEDFSCAHCGQQVSGNGYTNHCPQCLWSKHVDVSPGDRQADCGGLMEPVDLYLVKQDWIIVHQCQTCKFQRRQKVTDSDDFDAVIALNKKIVDKKFKQ